jgi:hypothetical protein
MLALGCIYFYDTGAGPHALKRLAELLDGRLNWRQNGNERLSAGGNGGKNGSRHEFARHARIARRSANGDFRRLVSFQIGG